MKKSGKIVRELVEATGIPQRQFAEKAGISISSLWDLMNGERLGKRHSATVVGVAKALGMTLEEFRERVEPSPRAEPAPGNFTIPRVSSVGADDGESDFEVNVMNDEGVPGFLYPKIDHDPMVMRVVGDSMAYDGRESIEDGDDVIFANQLEETIADGEIVVAHHPGKQTKTVKRLRRLPNGMIQLYPLNPQKKPLPPEHAEDVVLRAVKVVIRYRHKRNMLPIAWPDDSVRSPAAHPEAKKGKKK